MVWNFKITIIGRTLPLCETRTFQEKQTYDPNIE